MPGPGNESLEETRSKTRLELGTVVPSDSAAADGGYGRDSHHDVSPFPSKPCLYRRMRGIRTIIGMLFLAAGAMAQARPALQRPANDADARLIERAADSRLDIGARAKAVEALGEVPTPRARRYVRELISSANETPDILAAAIQSYTALMADIDIAEALRVAEKYLDHSEWSVREAAARALGKVGTPEAEEALRERWKREKTGVVRLALSAALIDAHRHRP